MKIRLWHKMVAAFLGVGILVTAIAGFLIERQLKDIRDGDILLWHLGIWSRQDPLWPQLDRLVGGLKARGLCFARLTDDKRWMR